LVTCAIMSIANSQLQGAVRDLADWPG